MLHVILGAPWVAGDPTVSSIPSLKVEVDARSAARDLAQEMVSRVQWWFCGRPMIRHGSSYECAIGLPSVQAIHTQSEGKVFLMSFHVDLGVEVGSLAYPHVSSRARELHVGSG